MEYNGYTHDYTARQNDYVVRTKKSRFASVIEFPRSALKLGQGAHKISFYKHFSFLGSPWVMTIFPLVRVLN